MAQADTGDDTRPDRRTSSPETLSLRAATRALRLHLDALPSDYQFGGPADGFFAEIAFPLARLRYDCAESLIGAGMGGTVLGSLARSLFVDGLRWQWIGESPPGRRTSLLASMLEERNRLCITLEQSEASCPNMARWLAPFTEIADVTGTLTWLQSPPMPSDDELLDRLLASPAAGSNSARLEGSSPSELLGSARRLLSITGLRGAVVILSHAGHGNLLGLQSSFTKTGAIGHDLRPDHEALFLQIAAVGVTVTLLGACVASPKSWPREVEQIPFLREALRLTETVVERAKVIHGLSVTESIPVGRRRSKTSRRPLLRPGVIVPAEDLLPDINSADKVAQAAEEYYAHARSRFTDLWSRGSPKLATALTFGGAHSSLMTVMSTYDKSGSAVVAAFAARMLLEEAARFVWLCSDSTEEVFAERSKRFFDDYRARRKKAIDSLTANGVPRATAEKLLELPENVVIQTPYDAIAKGRKPLPPIEKMLREMGEIYAYPEPGWLQVAYSLLSQVTHSTPIGHLHLIRFSQEQPWIGEISPELLALALDVACLGSAHLIGLSTAMLAGEDRGVESYVRELHKRAYDVHNAARFVHWLD